jgi:L-seryl-tRNA(Ser) seleniumtransferase
MAPAWAGADFTHPAIKRHWDPTGPGAVLSVMRKPSSSDPALSPGRPPEAAIPSVDRILRVPALAPPLAAHGRAAVLDAVRSELAALRREIAAHAGAAVALTHPDLIGERVAASLGRAPAGALRPVFNLTGVVLHTNLGRALLPREAIEAMALAAGRAAALEYDLDTGRRGDRDDHIEALLRRLTGAEAATVVNNNAAAVLLVLSTIATAREVVVSRGELIEIGGSFRLPEIMASAGCRLVEVGTTNRTHLRDYEGAVGSETALFMKVHPSNYEIRGFTSTVGEGALADLAHRHGFPLVSDLGSGALVDLRRWGLPYEPTPFDRVAAGVDLVTFSGDKLLGGPQAGIIVGRADLVARVKRNPLKRALRLDKVTIASLGAVLRLYTAPENLAERLPTLRYLTRPLAEIEAQAARLLPPMRQALSGRALVEIESCESRAGSGSLPADHLPSRALALRPVGDRRAQAARIETIAQSFRRLPVSVIGRLHDGALLFDLRCLDDEATFLAQLGELSLDSVPTS